MISVYWGEFLVSPVPLELSLNYCSHHCPYCFANLNDPKRKADVPAIMRLLSDFNQRTTPTAALLQAGYPVLISNHVDPFAVSNYRVALPLMQTLTRLNIPMVMQTRGGVGIDAALEFMKPTVWYISIEMLDDDLRQRLEPAAPPIPSRFELMRKLKAAGHRFVVGFNPCVPEWQPDYAAMIDAVKAEGAEGVWIERFHINPKQEANLTDRERALLTVDLLNRGRRRTGDPADNGHVRAAAQYAESIGLPTFSIGQGIRSDFFLPWHEMLPDNVFPTLQDFVNLCYDHDVEGPISFDDFADPMEEWLPPGRRNIGHYLGATAHNLWATTKIENWMTYRQLLGIAWADARVKFSPARMPCFAYVCVPGTLADPVVYVDDQEMPYLYFSKTPLESYYIEADPQDFEVLADAQILQGG